MRMADIFSDIMDGKSFWFPMTAVVESFDPALQTANLIPEMTVNGVVAPKINDVKCLFLGGAGWSVNVHLATGDRVAVMFCSTNVNLWLSGQNDGLEAAEPELHTALVIAAVRRGAGATAGTSPGVTIQNDSGTVKFMMDETGLSVNLTSPAGQNFSITGVAGMFNLLTHTHLSPAGGQTGGPTIGS